jgi:hypothetical protein
MPAPVASGWSGSPGGACTRWKSAALSRRTWKADDPDSAWDDDLCADSDLMVSCEHRSSSLSGSAPIAILKAGSDLISSQSLPSG